MSDTTDTTDATDSNTIKKKKNDLRDSNILQISPYINTIIKTEILLRPDQINSYIYENLKINLKDKYEGKCFMDYGFISKIYGITQQSGGIIISDTSLAAALYIVEFDCKLCKPLCGSTIICEVNTINRSVIHLCNGPIHVIIITDDQDQINKINFYYNEKKNLLLGNIGDGKSVPILQGSYVKVRCDAVRIEKNRNNIIVYGVMDSVATKKEYMNSEIDKETHNLIFTEYNKYISQENKNENENENKNENENENETI